MKKGGAFAAFAALGLAIWLFFPVIIQAARQQNGQEETEDELIKEQEKSQEALLEGLELGEMQKTVNELLGEETFNIRDALERILSGEEVFTKDFLIDTAKNFLFGRLYADQEVFFQILLLVLIAALFTNFTNVFSGSQAGEASFYIVYMLLLALLIHSFTSLSGELSKNLEDLITFMQALMPSYFLAVTAASGAGQWRLRIRAVRGYISRQALSAALTC